MQRTQWATRDEVIDSLALKTDRGDKAIIALVNDLGFSAEYVSTFENGLRAWGEHELANALLEGTL